MVIRGQRADLRRAHKHLCRANKARHKVWLNPIAYKTIGYEVRDLVVTVPSERLKGQVRLQ